jgi:hypothetical protein
VSAMTLAHGRTLDHHPGPEHRDERNKLYGIRRLLPETAAVTANLQNVSRFWQAGSFALDQGDTGHCGGFALANEAQSSPFRVTGVNNDYAHHAYYYAKDHKFDPWGREDGTSTQAIMRVGTSIGVWRGYAWSFSLADLRLSLEVGPTLCGTVWRTDMFTPNRDGVILPTGFDEGGHLWLLDGWYANFRGRSGRSYGPCGRLINSWGAGWGVNRRAVVPADGLADLVFGTDGEAGVPVNRAWPTVAP